MHLAMILPDQLVEFKPIKHLGRFVAHDKLFREHVLFFNSFLLVLQCEFLALKGLHRELYSILNQSLIPFWISLTLHLSSTLFINLIEVGSGIASKLALEVGDSFKRMITIIGDILRFV